MNMQDRIIVYLMENGPTTPSALLRDFGNSDESWHGLSRHLTQLELDNKAHWNYNGTAHGTCWHLTSYGKQVAKELMPRLKWELLSARENQP